VHIGAVWRDGDPQFGSVSLPHTAASLLHRRRTCDFQLLPISQNNHPVRGIKTNWFESLQNTIGGRLIEAVGALSSPFPRDGHTHLTRRQTRADISHKEIDFRNRAYDVAGWH